VHRQMQISEVAHSCAYAYANVGDGAFMCICTCRCRRGHIHAHIQMADMTCSSAHADGGYDFHGALGLAPDGGPGTG
jgi:hypothetical protein